MQNIQCIPYASNIFAHKVLKAKYNLKVSTPKFPPHSWTWLNDLSLMRLKNWLISESLMIYKFV